MIPDPGGCRCGCDASPVFETVLLRSKGFSSLPVHHGRGEIGRGAKCSENSEMESKACWRTGRDSNPRYPCEVRTFSKGVLSTTQPPILGTCVARRLHTAAKVRQPSREGNPAVFRRLEITRRVVALCGHAHALAPRSGPPRFVLAFRGREEEGTQGDQQAETGRAGRLDALRREFRADRGLRALACSGRGNVVRHWHRRTYIESGGHRRKVRAIFSCRYSFRSGESRGFSILSARCRIGGGIGFRRTCRSGGSPPQLETKKDAEEDPAKP